MYCFRCIASAIFRKAANGIENAATSKTNDKR